MRVAIYARVSSEEQREGQTIDSQIAELERYAQAQSWVVVGIYKDEGWSGAVLARPELDRLRDDATKKLFDIVLLNDVDRLARDVSHLGVIKRDIERQGAQVIFRKLPAEQSPTANLMVNILGSFAEFEREMIVDRTRRGRRHKVEVRQLFLGSLPPYGYRYVTKDQSASRDGYLEILPEQTTIVRQMFQWVDQEGFSTRGVVKRLNELRIAPPKGGRSWAKSSVTRILRCETYTGVWNYNKSESYAPAAGQRREYRRLSKYKHRPRPREDWIRVKLPDELRIIDPAQWERVQSQLSRNRSFSKRNSQHVYLLRGLVECGGCKARYVGDPNHGRFYYRCHRRCKRYPTVREELLDQTVWEAIEDILLNPDLVVKQIEKREQEKESKATVTESEMKEVEQGIERVDEEERRILEAYRAGILPPAILGRKLEQLRSRKNALTQRQREFCEQSQAPNLPVIRRTVFDYCRETASRLGALADAERQRLLQLLIERVIFRGDEITIRGFIPPRNSPSQQVENVGIAQEQAEDLAIDGIAAMEAYSHGRNSVEGMTFKLTKSLPRIRPLSNHDPDDLALVDRLFRANPQETLQQLCKRVQTEYNFTTSPSNLSRVLRHLGLVRRKRSCLWSRDAN